MAGVLKGYLATQSLPVDMENKMTDMQLVNQSSNSRVEELSELSSLIVEEDVEEREGKGDEDTDVEYDVVHREETAGMPRNSPHNARTSYGAISPSRLHRKRRRRRRSGGCHDVPPHSSLSPQALRPDNTVHDLYHTPRRYFSTTALTKVYIYCMRTLALSLCGITGLVTLEMCLLQSLWDRLIWEVNVFKNREVKISVPFQEYGTEYEQLLNHTGSASGDYEDHHSSVSSDEEDPPLMEMIYRRTFKDKTKLIIIPLLYFLFFVMAGIFAFYSIEALVESYRHRVRTASYVTVDRYDAPGIAFFLEVSGMVSNTIPYVMSLAVFIRSYMMSHNLIHDLIHIP